MPGMSEQTLDKGAAQGGAELAKSSVTSSPLLGDWSGAEETGYCDPFPQEMTQVPTVAILECGTILFFP